MVETYILYFKQLNKATVKYIQEEYLVYSWLEFTIFTEVIIKRQRNMNIFNLKLEFLYHNLSYPFEVFNPNAKYNRYIYPSCNSNTKCIQMYTINK